METFEYVNPVRILFGIGKRQQVGEEIKKLGRRRALLVAAKGPFRENGLYEWIRSALATAGIQTVGMSDIDSNPRITSVREGAALCKQQAVDCVLALGGGSAMDCAKVIAAAAKSADDPWEHLWGHKRPFRESLDTVLVPTIAATGTDTNPWAVILDETAVWKMPVTADCMYAKLVIADPEIMASVPIRLTVWGAMDILSHTFEFYFNGYHRSLFQNRFSEAIVRTVMECVELLRADPRDLRARGELWWASVMAWGGLTWIGREGPDMACHDMAEGFVPFYDTHHGATLGVITPRWMRSAVARGGEKVEEIFSRFAREIFGISERKPAEAARQGVEAYIRWLRSVEAPASLPELTGREIPEAKLREIAAKTFADLHRGVGKLVPVTEADAVDILKASCRSL